MFNFNSNLKSTHIKYSIFQLFNAVLRQIFALTWYSVIFFFVQPLYTFVSWALLLWTESFLFCEDSSDLLTSILFYKSFVCHSGRKSHICGALFAKPTSFLHYLLDFSQTLNFGLLGCSNLGARKKVSKSLLSRYLAIYEGSERKPKKTYFFMIFKVLFLQQSNIQCWIIHQES